QAEDGIRDRNVTGVQTCALPIWVAVAMLPDTGQVLVIAGPGGNGGDGLFAGAHLALAGHTVHAVLVAERAHEAALATFQAAGGEIGRASCRERVSDGGVDPA